MMRIVLLVLATVLSLGACSEHQAEPKEDRGRVVLYTGYQDTDAVSARIAGFTAETGIYVRVKSGDPALIVDAVINDNGTPPPDLLLTPDIFGIWHAAENGGLRALRSENIESTLPSRFRDPDNLWFATAVDAISIAFHNLHGDLSELQTYEELAGDEYAGRLCLASSALPSNRVFVAMLIDKLGVRPTERVVRGMITNLARPVFDSDEALLMAIESGDCAVGVVAALTAQQYVDIVANTRVGVTSAMPAYFNVEGAGVARHARNPDAAKQLLEWLIERGNTGVAPLDSLSDRNVGIAAWRGEDARLLAERASYP